MIQRQNIQLSTAQTLWSWLKHPNTLRTDQHEHKWFRPSSGSWRPDFSSTVATCMQNYYCMCIVCAAGNHIRLLSAFVLISQWVYMLQVSSIWPHLVTEQENMGLFTHVIFTLNNLQEKLGNASRKSWRHRIMRNKAAFRPTWHSAAANTKSFVPKHNMESKAAHDEKMEGRKTNKSGPSLELGAWREQSLMVVFSHFGPGPLWTWSERPEAWLCSGRMRAGRFNGYCRGRRSLL